MWYVAKMIYNNEDYEVIEIFKTKREAKEYCKKDKDLFYFKVDCKQQKG